MSSWDYDFLDKAVKELTKLPPSIKTRIGSKLKWYISQDDPVSFATKLVGNNTIGSHRYRVGDYRILCDIDIENKIITVLTVKHRREVYER